MDTSLLPILLGIAILLPLISFFVILAVGRWCEPVAGGYLATAAIVSAGALSAWSLTIWLAHHPVGAAEHYATGHAAVHSPPGTLVAQPDPVAPATDDAATQQERDAGHAAGPAAAGPAYVGDYYVLGQFGKLRITIGYYIDALTIVMCCMVSLIAACIHFYALGYMREELDTVTDHEVTLQDGSPLRRPGRFSNFFQYMSLFCFSMLGLVVAGNVAMVFVFWELVGICSYFLIGFYIERKSVV